MGTCVPLVTELIYDSAVMEGLRQGHRDHRAKGQMAGRSVREADLDVQRRYLLDCTRSVIDPNMGSRKEEL